MNTVFTSIFDLLRKVFRECSTAASGEFDPARVVGYGTTTIGAFIFFGLSIYDTIVNKKFDAAAFSLGLVSISGALVGAAAGVTIKKNAEGPADTADTPK